MPEPLAPPRGVAYVLTHYPRVTQTFIAAEIGALRAAGVRVVPMAMNPPGPADADDPEVAGTLYLKTTPPRRVLAAVGRALRRSPRAVLSTAVLAARSAGADLGGQAKRGAHLLEAIVVWDACVREDLDHVHAHFGQSPSTIAWLTAELARRADAGPQRWTFTVHCASEVYDAKRTLPTAKLASADATVCVSDHTRSQILWGADPSLWDRAVVVRVGIDLAAHPQRPPHALADRPRILIVGRLAPAKAHVVLVEAVAALRDRGVDVVVEALGEGDARPAIEARIGALGVGDRVVLHGEVAPGTVRAYLEEADVFCLPSFDEGLPVSMMEAMAVGVPVVTSYVAGIPELAIDGRTALVVPAANAGALADALERLLADASLRDALVAGARARVEAFHDDRETLPRLLAVLGVEGGGR